eukprot:2195568-Prymnesium_polylepis.1
MAAVGRPSAGATALASPAASACEGLQARSTKPSEHRQARGRREEEAVACGRVWVRLRVRERVRVGVRVRVRVRVRGRVR